MESTTTFQRRFNGRCRKCKKIHSALVTFERNALHGTRKIVAIEGDGATPGMYGVIFTCCANVKVFPREVKGTLRPDRKCNRVCTGARGHDCECSCGGLNHGADWQVSV